MNFAPEKKYSLSRTGDSLVFRTASFAPGRGSLLHSGIYNREFSSMLASMAAAISAYMILALNSRKTQMSSIIAAVIFLAGFPLFRAFVFKGRHLELVIDRTAGTAEIYIAGFRKKLQETIFAKDIENLRVDKNKPEIINPDGVKFVEKISLQHGVPIPDFGEETVFYLLKLLLKDGSDRLIYSDSAMEDVLSAHDEIKKFMQI